MSNRKLKIIFCGTPDFSVPTLDLLFNHPSIEILYVLTMPDRPVGRGLELKSPPVAEFAKANKIPLIQTENINRDEEKLSLIEKLDVDFVMVLAFAQFLGSRFLAIPKLGAFNIHTSILPKYRGAAPIQYALLNGDKSTGVSIQKMVKQMDAGDLVHFQSIEIGNNETGGQLYTRLKFLAALSTNTFISDILSNKIVYTPQKHEEATFAPTLKKEDGFLDFINDSAEKIFNKVRALDPWPGTYFTLSSMRTKVLKIEITNETLKPGLVDIKNGQLLIGTTTKAVHISTLQLEGKKACSDNEFLNGIKNKKINLEITQGV